MKFLSELRFVLQPNNNLHNEDARLEYMTRVMFAIIGISLNISAITVFILDFTSEKPVFWPSLLMLVMVTMHGLTWLFIRFGYWRIARIFPPAVFIATGAFLITRPELISVAILQFVIAIILTANLFNSPAQWISVLLSSFSFLIISQIFIEQYDSSFIRVRYLTVLTFGAISILLQISERVVTQAIQGLHRETQIRKNLQDSAEQKEKILSAIAKSAQLLIDSTDWRASIDEMLKLLGKAANASHAYLFQNHLDKNNIAVTSQKHEWVAEGQMTELDNPEYQNVPLLEKPMQEWYAQMQNNLYFYKATKDLSPDWAVTENRKKIKTLLDVPVFVDNQWWGVIGFDDYVNESSWSQAEIDTMRIAAGLLGSAITRQIADEELRASEDKFETIFHQSLVPMVIGNLPERLILDVNPAFTTLSGFSREESINHYPTDLRIWVSQAEREEHRKILNHQGYLREYKAHLRKKSGEIAVVLLSVSMVKVNSEDCLLYTIYEITQLEKVLNELQDKNNELERFTYTVSHDLKAPLITIGGFAGLLARDLKNGKLDKTHRSIERILDAVNKMERLLNELLELSRVGRMMNEPQAVPFEEIAKEAVELIQGRLRANSLTVKIEADLPIVKVDHARIVEAVQNLLDNAAKFTLNQENPKIVIGANQESEGWVFFVRDNGIGIEEKYYDRVFGLFNKLDSNTEGTGIGLALVKRKIEYHGGKIWLESEIGKGTSFYFTLPM